MRGTIIFFGNLLCSSSLLSHIQPCPLGRQLYNLLNVQDSDYAVLGIGAKTLVIAVFNGLIYGLTVWIIYTFAERTKKERQKLDNFPSHFLFL